MHVRTLIIMKFQFHKGTIRTDEGTWMLMLSTEFQFHKGTIRTGVVDNADDEIDNFNSIKVRLERLFQGFG